MILLIVTYSKHLWRTYLQCITLYTCVIWHFEFDWELYTYHNVLCVCAVTGAEENKPDNSGIKLVHKVVDCVIVMCLCVCAHMHVYVCV